MATVKMYTWTATVDRGKLTKEPSADCPADIREELIHAATQSDRWDCELQDKAARGEFIDTSGT